MTGRLLFIGAAAVYDRLQEKIFGRPAEVASYKPKVAVLIPAYNEEKVIVRTVRAALNSDYPNLRVIVIDDGSRDRTLEVARACFCRGGKGWQGSHPYEAERGQGRGSQLRHRAYSGCRTLRGHRCRYDHRG